jgi:hypothetical protein
LFSGEEGGRFFQEAVFLFQLADTPFHLGDPGAVDRLTRFFGPARILFLLRDHPVADGLRDQSEIAGHVGVGTVAFEHRPDRLCP